MAKRESSRRTAPVRKTDIDGTNFDRLREDHKYALLGKLTAGVVHEIRNPLSVLALSLDTLGAGASDDPRRRDALQHARLSVDRIHRIVSSTLSFAREHAPSTEPVDVRALIADTLPLVSATVRGKRIDFRTAMPRLALPCIPGDRGLLQQALVNLLTNAVDSIARSGTITVRASARQSTVAIAVIDTGSGMAKDVCEKLFTPFYTSKADGTGLGLAITRAIVERHGATITVRSAPGAGTTFTLVFPCTRVA